MGTLGLLRPLSLLQPHLVVPSIYELDLDMLHQQGIRGLILDIDNTVVAWGSKEVPPALRSWVEEAGKKGLGLCFSSNARSPRVAEVSRLLGVPGIPNAAKPRRHSFRQAMYIMGTRKEETAVVGDQLFTDVLGGNRLGLFTILVNPIAAREFFFTRLVRRLERLVLHLLHIGRSDRLEGRLRHRSQGQPQGPPYRPPQGPLQRPR